MNEPVGEHSAREEARVEALALALPGWINAERVADDASIQPHSAPLAPEASRFYIGQIQTDSWLEREKIFFFFFLIGHEGKFTGTALDWLLLAGPRDERRRCSRRVAAGLNERVAFVNMSVTVCR